MRAASSPRCASCTPAARRRPPREPPLEHPRARPGLAAQMRRQGLRLRLVVVDYCQIVSPDPVGSMSSAKLSGGGRRGEGDGSRKPRWSSGDGAPRPARRRRLSRRCRTGQGPGSHAGVARGRAPAGDRALASVVTLRRDRYEPARCCMWGPSRPRYTAGASRPAYGATARRATADRGRAR